MSEAELDDMLDVIRAEIEMDGERENVSFGPVPRAANDNGLVWPLLPFPEGWCASS